MTVMHKGRTQGEDDSVVIVEFENGAIGVAENSWAKLGGMDDSVEVFGTGGVVYADLFRGNAAVTYSEEGYGYAMEKAGNSKGWTFTILKRPSTKVSSGAAPLHRMRARKQNPKVTGEDGRAVEIMLAAYESAGTGRRSHYLSIPRWPNPLISGWIKDLRKRRQIEVSDPCFE